MAIASCRAVQVSCKYIVSVVSLSKCRGKLQVSAVTQKAVLVCLTTHHPTGQAGSAVFWRSALLSNSQVNRN